MDSEPVAIVMKQRMSTADVAAEVACLRARILNMRVMNVYDINAKVRPLLGSLSASISAPKFRLEPLWVSLSEVANRNLVRLLRLAASLRACACCGRAALASGVLPRRSRFPVTVVGSATAHLGC